MRSLSFSLSLVFIFALIILFGFFLYPPRALALHFCPSPASCLKACKDKFCVQGCYDQAKISCAHSIPKGSGAIGSGNGTAKPKPKAFPRPPRQVQVAMVAGGGVSFMQFHCTSKRDKESCEKPLTEKELSFADHEARRRGRQACRWVEIPDPTRPEKIIKKCTLANVEAEVCARKSSLGCVWLLVGGTQNGSCVDSRSGYKQNDICSTAGFAERSAFPLREVPRTTVRGAEGGFPSGDRMKVGRENMAAQLTLAREQLKDQILPKLGDLERRIAIRTKEITEAEKQSLLEQIEQLRRRMEFLQSKL